MVVVEVETGQKHKVVISRVVERDFKTITKQRYYFDWKQEKKFEILKLQLEDDSDILGLISFEQIPKEWRIHVRLLTVSKENRGSEKQYDRIVGNLLTCVSKQSMMDYAEMSCVSLIPKSKIADHYIQKYGMRITGRTLSLELPEILNLITEYDHD